jgi:hypothetical protein
VPARKRTTKDSDSNPLFATPKDSFIVETIADAEASRGLVNVPFYPPSRHLRAAQAALANSSVYRTTSKQERANQKAIQQKISSQDVQDFLKAEGYIEEDAVISDNFEDPYVDLDKWRMHDAYRRDSSAKRAVTVLADFVLGQRTKHTLDVNKQEYTKEQDQQQALDTITNNPTYQAYVYQLDCINRDVNFDYYLTAAFIQMKVFGRALILIQDDPDTGLPVALKLVSSMRIGRVFVDELTWKIVAVEYLDYSGLDSIIPAQKMIYLRNEDYAISPNVYGFGYSTFEPILDIAETNRQLWSVAIKEINKSQWAPYLIVKVNSKRRTQLQKIADSLKPGLPFVHNQDIQSIQTIEMHHDLEKILQEIDTNERTIAYTVGVPNFLMGKEDVTNRATTATVIDAWTKSKIEKERTCLRGVIEPQWVDRNLAIMIKNGFVERNLKPDKPALMTMQYNDPRTGKPTKGNVNPNNPFAFDSGNGKKKAANAADMPPQDRYQIGQKDQPQPAETTTPPPQTIAPDTPVSSLEFKVKFEFEPINLDTSLEIAQPVVTLEQAGIIDATKAREWLHAQDIEARMKDQEAQNQKMAQMIATGQAAQFQQMKGAENKAMQQKNNQQQQNPNQNQKQQPVGGKGQLPQVGTSLQATQPIAMSASASMEHPNSASAAAAKIRMQADRRRMELYDEISDAVQQIARN